MGHKLVCLTCQKALNLSTDYETRAIQSVSCPDCHGIAIPYPHRFRPPKKLDNRRWEVVQFLYENGFTYKHVPNSEGSGYMTYPETLLEAREFVKQFKK